MAYRAILAFILSLLVLLLWQHFFTPKKAPIKEDGDLTLYEQKKEEPAAFSLPIEKSSQGTDLGKDIIISTPLYQVVFSQSGSMIKSFTLKKYRQNINPNSPPQELIGTNTSYLPLGIRFIEHSLSLDTVKFRTENEKLNFSPKDSPKAVNFIAETNGIIIKKTFIFYPDSYHIDFNLSLTNQTSNPFKDSIAISLSNKWSKKDHYGFNGAILLVNEKLEEIKAEKIKEEIIKTGKINWVGLSDKYFSTIIANKEVRNSGFILNKKEEVLLAELVTAVEVRPKEENKQSFLLYFGPKEITRLKKLDFHLDKAINFGFFDSFAKLLLYSLKWFNKYIHNYGLAIILLTIVIKILFWPLTHTSFKSMKELQKLQPHINRLREKYKNDKERLNRELMNLYKTYKVNPLGGCLPILIQIPIFFGLYKALLYAIELRHARFIDHIPFTKYIWLADLSAKDPYYITPILMGISMVIQQKMTPTAMDPRQAKLMMLMPIFFTFLFLNFPSGLVLYWLVNNILSIAQQIYTHRKLK
jgi:YidC/Oxa1 family membrane protein insertase